METSATTEMCINECDREEDCRALHVARSIGVSLHVPWCIDVDQIFICSRSRDDCVSHCRSEESRLSGAPAHAWGDLASLWATHSQQTYPRFWVCSISPGELAPCVRRNL